MAGEGASASAGVKPLAATDISRRATDMSKAMNSASTPADFYERTLKELRTGVSATEDLLRSTRIGVIVNRIKDNVKDPGVRDQAAALIKKWKADIAAKKRDSPARATGTAGTAGAGTNGKGSGSSTPTPAAKAAAPEKWKGVKPEARNATTDGVDYKRTGNTGRDACAKSLYDGLAFMSEHAPSHILPLALSIEKACFDAHGPETSTGYRDKIRTLFLNLKNKSSSHLRDAVTSTPPSITPEKLVRMSADDMKSKELVEADLVRHKENLHNAMTAKEDKAVSSMLTCGQCGQKKVTYTQAQTRSADEPMTTFCECSVCGKKWKFS